MRFGKTSSVVSNPDEVFFPGGGEPANIGRVWGNWGEYMLIPKMRQWAMEQLGVSTCTLGVDLFATPGLPQQKNLFPKKKIGL